MSDRKRVTLTFEIDDHDGFNDEAFMRRDFLQELSCCVNDPYEDTFVMKVEDANVPQDMRAREYARHHGRMCSKAHIFCNDCPLYSADYDCVEFERDHPEEAIAIVKKWAEEHPEERSEE